MFTKRTDLAIEAHELWQESAGKTTRLAGVKATEKKIQGYPVTQVDILDREGVPHWESLRAVTAPLTSPPSGRGGMGFSTGRCGPWGSKSRS